MPELNKLYIKFRGTYLIKGVFYPISKDYEDILNVMIANQKFKKIIHNKKELHLNFTPSDFTLVCDYIWSTGLVDASIYYKNSFLFTQRFPTDELIKFIILKKTKCPNRWKELL